jgi:primosomal protein N' (replication factor Y)
VAALRDGRPARAAWSALPGEDWPTALAQLAGAELAAGRGSILIVPDARDLARVDAALKAELGPARHVALSAELGPQARYRRWLAVRRGGVQVVAGTRAAAYAPVGNLGLLAIWDDGDDLHAEQRAPYPHVRDVLALRSTLERSALLIGGYARTVEAQLLLDSGWARAIAADRAVLRAAAPRVRAVGDDVELARDPGATAARLPSLAWRTAREALALDRPVLIQVPRRGHLAALSCRNDGAPARCPTCAGPLSAASATAPMQCRWCGRIAVDWSCPVCGRRALRAGVIGSARTAEELGRAFPDTAVRLSGGDAVLDRVPDEPALVVATPGAEPAVGDSPGDGPGYGAALLLDGWALLGRPDLRAAEETLRRWMAAAALVRAGGPVIVGADAAVPAVQALIRWDPGAFAARELSERAELGFPPAVRMAALTGQPAALRQLVDTARQVAESTQLPPDAELLGPVPAPSRRGDRDDQAIERLLIRVPRPQGAQLAAALHAAAAIRSARKAPDPVRIELDPQQLA